MNQEPTPHEQTLCPPSRSPELPVRVPDAAFDEQLLPSSAELAPRVEAGAPGDDLEEEDEDEDEDVSDFEDEEEEEEESEDELINPE